MPIPDQQKQALKNSSSRAKNEVSRTTPGDFRTSTRKRNACPEKEYMIDDPDCGNGKACDPDFDPFCDGICPDVDFSRHNFDGVCDKIEDCEEIVGDGIGDEDGLCEANNALEPPKKKIREPCVLVCDPAVIEADDENFDDDLDTELETALDDAASTGEQLAVQLQTTIVAASARRELVKQAMASETIAGCEGLLAAGTINLRPDDPSLGSVSAPLQVAQTLKNVLQGVNDACQPACNQDIVGNNCEAACTAPAVLATAATWVSDGLVIWDDTVTAERVDATAHCLEKAATELKRIGALNSKTPRCRRGSLPFYVGRPRISAV